MVGSLSRISNGKVYPVEIQFAGRNYWTLYYYTADGDGLLHDGQHIICFNSIQRIWDFCQSHQLSLEGEAALYDFDTPIKNPLDYSKVLNRWNLLDTIAEMLSMYFEGKRREYDSLYDKLFRCSTCAQDISSVVYFSKKDICKLRRIFKRQKRYFERFTREVPKACILRRLPYREKS